jgi:ABC-2 type transport system ATP-binding protein
MGSDAIGELAAAEGVVLHELSPQRGSLEEAFFHLTGDSVEYQTDLGEPAEPAVPTVPAEPGAELVTTGAVTR